MYMIATLYLSDALRKQFPSARFVPALARLSQAHAALGQKPDWLQPKGMGVVCVKKGGIKKDSFVHFYFGKMCDIGHFIALTRLSNLTILSHSYTPSKWFEREAAIQVIKVRRTFETPALLQLTFFKGPGPSNQRFTRRLLQYYPGKACIAARGLLSAVPDPLLPFRLYIYLVVF
jgi:hypothetical protein